MSFFNNDQSSPVRHYAVFLLLIGACLTVSGCGNGLAQVSGQVTLDGQPLRGGKDGARVTVQFQPANGSGATAVGLADKDGNYEIATGSQLGIQPGDYIVTCSASEAVVSNNPSSAPAFRQLVDTRYASPKTSDLKYSVQAGKNEFDISLVSNQGSAVPK